MVSDCSWALGPMELPDERNLRPYVVGPIATAHEVTERDKHRGLQQVSMMATILRIGKLLHVLSDAARGADHLKTRIFAPYTVHGLVRNRCRVGRRLLRAAHHRLSRARSFLV
ncbi:MAG: hypothetical protein DMG13_23535 [Acidobacteria bacterium]|nr:MAG: hypothetical protein DMG13_23535 [Acidobacteriota bacterium]